MKTIKIQIQSQIECEIEIKKDQDLYRLIVIKSASENDNGKAWHGKTHDNSKISSIERLIVQCHAQPSSPILVRILDGTIIMIKLDGQKTLTIKDIFEENSCEVILLNSIFDFCNSLIKDSNFEHHTKLWPSVFQKK